MIVAALLVAAAAQAAATTGAGWLNVPISVPQAGMGEVSVAGRDVLRAWSNPALLADRGTRGEVALNGGSLLGGGRSVFALGAGWQVSPRWTFGAALSFSSLAFDGVDEYGDPTGTRVDRGTAAGAAMAAWSPGAVRIGVALKGVSDSVAADSASGVAADAGVAWRAGGLTVAAAARNFGPKLRTGAGGDEMMPLEFRGGLGYTWPVLGLSIAVEQTVADLARGGGAGAEWWLTPRFAVRAGVAGFGADNGISATGGLSARFGVFGLDYAAQTHTLGLTHRMSVSFAFGREPLAPSAEPAALPEAVEVAAAPAAEPIAPPPRRKPGSMNVAVAELSPQNVSAGDAAVISDILRGELVRLGAFAVVEKQNMDKILAEQGFQQTGCSSEECAVKLGKILNVHRMVVGSFGKLLDSYLLNARVIDVETGRVIYADRAAGRTVEDLQDAVVGLAKRLGKVLK